MKQAIVNSIVKDDLVALKTYMNIEQVGIDYIFYAREEGDDYDSIPLLHIALAVARKTGKSKCVH